MDIQKKNGKLTKYHSCEICNFECKKHGDYTRHLDTMKHKINVGIEPPKPPKPPKEKEKKYIYVNVEINIKVEVAYGLMKKNANLLIINQ